MTGKTKGQATPTNEPSLGSLDADSVHRIDVHLQRALAAADDDKDFHVRHARQILEACKDA